MSDGTTSGNPGTGTSDGGTQTQPAPNQTAWHSQFAGEELGWIQNRGLDKLPAEQAIPQLVKGFRSAESKYGVPTDRVLVLPQNGTDATAMNEVWNKLGRPETPDKYTLVNDDKVEGADNEFNTWFKNTAHGLGLTQQQTHELHKSLDALVEQRANQDSEATDTANAAELEKLKTEWGATFDRNVSVARTAAAKFGVSKEALDALEKQIGYSEVIKMFQKIGVGLGEDNFIASNVHFGGQSAPSTPESARARIAELKFDKTFVQRMQKGDREANKIWTNLHIVASGGKVE